MCFRKMGHFSRSQALPYTQKNGCIPCAIKLQSFIKTQADNNFRLLAQVTEENVGR